MEVNMLINQSDPGLFVLTFGGMIVLFIIVMLLANKVNK